MEVRLAPKGRPRPARPRRFRNTTSPRNVLPSSSPSRSSRPSMGEGSSVWTLREMPLHHSAAAAEMEAAGRGGAAASELDDWTRRLAGGAGWRMLDSDWLLGSASRATSLEGEGEAEA